MTPLTCHSSMRYNLIFSSAFKLTLQRLVSFLERKFSTGAANRARREIRDKITVLSEQPKSGPICQRLLDLGVAGYRQLLIGDHNMVVYRVDEKQHTVSVLLVFDTRQSLQKLLTDLQLAL